MPVIDPLEVLREKLSIVEQLIKTAQDDIARYERERIALMVAIGALEREAKGPNDR